MKSVDRDQEPISKERRDLLKAIAGAAGLIGSRILLPALWSAPVIASMPLPAHADMSAAGPSCSGASLDPPAGSVLEWRTVIVVSQAAGSDSTHRVVTVQVNPTTKLRYQVYERSTGANGINGVCVVGLAVPTFAGAVAFPLTRTVNEKLAYQVRWSGGHTDWVNITVGK